jgi:hypothetical protein
MHIPSVRRRAGDPGALSGERGVNYLLVTLVGIAIALIFMVFNVGGLLVNLDTARTVKAKEVLSSDVSNAVHGYLINNSGQLPIQGGFTDVMATTIASYLSSTPCDPSDTACTPTSASSDIQYAAGSTDWAAYDTYARPARTLNGLPRFAGVGNAPGSVCDSTSCMHLVYDGKYGMLGDT